MVGGTNYLRDNRDGSLILEFNCNFLACASFSWVLGDETILTI